MSELLTALALIFVVAGALLIVANHFSLPTVPFLLLAGLIAGPFIDPALLLELAQWGIAFLVFVFGVHLDLRSIGTLVREAEVVAGIGLLVVGVLGFAVGIALGYDELNALYFSITAALSSTIVGAGLLQEEIRENLVYGRLAQSIHFVQDLVAIVLVLMLSADAFTPDAISAGLGYGVMFLAVAYVINAHLFTPVSRLADGSQELLMIGSISILIAFLAAAELAGISIVVGAFAAGLAIERDFTRNLGMLNGIESIKDFFVAVFFVTIGALVLIETPDLTVLATAGMLILITALVKPAVTLATILWEGYESRTATLTSVSLDQVSEFALIIAIEAFVIGLMAPELFQAVILAAAVTMVTATYTRRHDDRIHDLVLRVGFRSPHVKTDERSRVDETLSGHVVIVGYGRQARRLVETVEAGSVPYVVIENDPGMLSPLQRNCRNFVFGDAMSEYTWEKARVSEASLVVSTASQPRLSERVLSLEADADVILRARTVGEASALVERGALYVNVPDLLAADSLLDHVREVTEEPAARERLRRRHLDELLEFDRMGFASMSEEIKR
ncbi:cation:proton antiporter domain-containing protein [Natronorarus salvus]|uniref:cation:proton antiporter domain-containing protein n=1 Tax=Natronorarus salvus TaxID=3117733 RepID=UPI002F269769